MSALSNSGGLPPLDFSRWRKVPDLLIGGGLVLCLLGALLDLKQFGYSWLLAFMFYLSLVLGAAFLVMMHHLFDAELVGGHPPVLRAPGLPGLPLDGPVLPPHRAAGAEDLLTG